MNFNTTKLFLLLKGKDETTISNFSELRKPEKSVEGKMSSNTNGFWPDASTTRSEKYAKPSNGLTFFFVVF